MSSTVRAWISLSVARMPGLSIWKQPMVRPRSTSIGGERVIVWDAVQSFQATDRSVDRDERRAGVWRQELAHSERRPVSNGLSHIAQHGQAADAEQVDLDQTQALDQLQVELGDQAHPWWRAGWAPGRSAGRER